jgi:hypothetical protein
LRAGVIEPFAIDPMFAPLTYPSDSISRVNSDIDSIQLPARLPSQFGDQVFKYKRVLMAIFWPAF